MVRQCPALFLAAPASNQGKTTVTAALARLHSRMGRKVRLFKCGPDFLDPQILEAASGAPVYNVDLWMCGEEDAAHRLYAAAEDADIILVEGVMGLYDGIPSGADFARRFNLPILAVMDGAKMAQTFGAVALGLTTYQKDKTPELQFAGFLANRVGSAAHATMLRDSLPPFINWLGHLPRDAEASLPERHLGLVQATEIEDLLTRIDRVADLLVRTEVGSLIPLVDFSPASPPKISQTLAGKTIAIAHDDAFAFIYKANLDCLKELGAQLVFFSPLTDKQLPDCDALWFPGGYPELYAAQLAENRSLWKAVKDHHQKGLPILAECGGMMSLFEKLTDIHGAHHDLGGLLPGTTTMQSKLSALGLQQVDLPEGNLRGHTFHYSKSQTSLEPLVNATTSRGRGGEPVYRVGSLTASYVHYYFPSNPRAVAKLFGG